MEYTGFLHADTNSAKVKVISMIFVWADQKWACYFRPWDSKIGCISRMNLN